MAIEDADTDELLYRFNDVVQKYVPLAAKLAPMVEEFGRYRQELQLIVAELKNRGIEPQEREDLEKIIEEALKNKKEEVSQADGA